MTAEMYNAEQKNRFLMDIDGTYAVEAIANIRSIFNRIAPFEGELGKDVCNFSREEISNLYSMLMYSSKYVYSSVNSRLKTYTEWCLSQMLVDDGCNHFQEFTSKDYDKYVNKRVISNKFLTRENYERLVRSIPNSRDQFLVMCLFEFGKSTNFDDIFGMKLEDIDQEKREVKLRSGRTVKVSEELIAKAIEANTDMKYLMPGREVYRNLIPGPYIFKRNKAAGEEVAAVDNGGQNTKFVARLMKNLVDYCGANRGINADAIAVSGQFDMIRRRASEIGITEEEYIRGHFDDLTSQYKTNPAKSKAYWEKYGAYL